MPPASSFCFGKTHVQSLGIAPGWLTFPPGDVRQIKRGIVGMPSLPNLLGLDVILELGFAIAPGTNAVIGCFSMKTGIQLYSIGNQK